MKEIKVLDKGFVYLVDSMGDDGSVVQAARVSYQSAGTATPEKDKKLIAFLLKHHHGTPFEHTAFKWHVKLPLFVARQWIRHRIASFNELSRRYTEVDIKIGSTDDDQFYIPNVWRIQDTKNKQGSKVSGRSIEWHDNWSKDLIHHCASSMDLYRRMVKGGIAKEMARMALPVNLYTEWYFTANARAMLHFFGLRSEAHAQWETRQYSDAMWKIFADQMPWTAEAFMKTLDLDRYEGILKHGVPRIQGTAV